MATTHSTLNKIEQSRPVSVDFFFDEFLYHTRHNSVKRVGNSFGCLEPFYENLVTTTQRIPTHLVFVKW